MNLTAVRLGLPINRANCRHITISGATRFNSTTFSASSSPSLLSAPSPSPAHAISFSASRSSSSVLSASCTSPSIAISSPPYCFSTASVVPHHPPPPPLLHLSERAVLCLSCPQRDTIVDFLQRLLTADLHQLQPNRPLYSLMLNARGRVLHELLVYAGDSCSDHQQEQQEHQQLQQQQLWLETDAVLAPRLRSLLTIYRVRRPISVELAEPSSVLVAVALPGVGGALHNSSGGSSGSGGGSGGGGSSNVPWQGTVPHGWSVLAGGADPRSSELGTRLLLTPSAAAAAAAAADVAGAQPPCLVPSLSTETGEYRRRRLTAGVAEGGDEVPCAGCTPLEYNGDYSAAVGFSKGCYVGQELTARTHHTGVVRKRVMPVRWHQTASEDGSAGGEAVCQSRVRGCAVSDPDGRAVGKVLASEREVGLALLHVQRALSAQAPLSVTDCDGRRVLLTPYRPSWWPA